MLKRLLATLAALLALPAAAQSPAHLPEPLAAYVTQAMAAAEVPGLAVAVIHGDDPPIAQGFGVRRLGRSERVDENTVFHIASLAKSFTAAAVAALVSDGTMRWDDPVSRWLPALRFGDPWLTEHVTLADLLSHRTGLESANSMFRLTHIDRAEILRRVRFLAPAQPFRTRQVYNNVLYTVAGEAAAAAAGTSWEELVRSRLLVPLGMRRTLAIATPDPSGNVAAPHAVIDGRQQPIRPESYASIGPAGGMHSTATDMLIWLRFQMGNGEWQARRIVAADAMAAMHEPQTLIPTNAAMRAGRQVEFFAGYGFGWNVMDYRGHKLLWHSGNADGMPSFMAILPDDRIAVVVMLNSWIAPFLHGDVASRIFDHYLGLPTRDYAAETLAALHRPDPPAPAAQPVPNTPPLDLSAYAGTYRSDLYGPIAVTRTAAGLSLQMGEGEQADLAPLNRDTFALRWRDRVIGEDNDTRVTFALDDRGRVVRLALNIRADRVVAERNDGAAQ